jgi:type II secretory pathway component PulC
MGRKEKRYLIIIVGLVLLVEAVSIFFSLTISKRIDTRLGVAVLKRLPEIAEVKTKAFSQRAIEPLKILFADKKEDLQLELMGTVIGNIKNPIAYIKDLKTGKVGSYKLGHLIREARIIEITLGKVVFDREGEKEVLLANSRLKSKNKSALALVEVSPGLIEVNKRALMQDALSVYKSFGSIKIKPHYEAGVVRGVMVEGMDEGNIVQAAGISNNDVILTINNQKIDSYQKALLVAHKIKNQSEIKLNLLRNGEFKRLTYHVSK